jgi:type IX secretion system PorP/SprF family membrane protein
MSVIKKLLPILLLIFSFNASDGQQTPLNPISYWVFVPYIYNPAIVGSKDFISIDMNAAFEGKSKSQVISGNIRFSKTQGGYFSSPDIIEFENSGIGGSVFNDANGRSRNTGLSAAGSYQIPLGTRKLSFLSFGASVKGVYNRLDTADIESGNFSKKTFYANLDLGLYYFSSNFFSGFSITNLLNIPDKNNNIGMIKIPVSRQYFFTAGYKFIISTSQHIVLEPSLLISTYDSTFNKIPDNINPILKFYVGNFCVGTYFLGNGKTSFFAQFRYPKFYVGTFFELPKKIPYFKRIPLVEFTLGLNLQIDKSRLSDHSHW